MSIAASCLPVICLSENKQKIGRSALLSNKITFFSSIICIIQIHSQILTSVNTTFQNVHLQAFAKQLGSNQTSFNLH